jgi:chemotaxis protein MotB
MWLLNATTEKQRKGLADYFTPSIAVNRVSGGGDGAFGGDSVFTEQTLSQSGTGASNEKPTEAREARGATTASGEEAAGETTGDPLSNIEDVLLGSGGEAVNAREAMRHIATRLTDEGLVVEIFDLEGAPLFEGDTTTPTAVMQDISALISRVFSLTPNGIAVAGHTSARPLVVASSPIWDLSASRAQQVRRMLTEDSLSDVRFKRITGHADRALSEINPMDVRNNRIEVILLRSGV